MEGYGWVLFGAGLVFFGGIFAYLMFMIFLPEWVGITGETAKKAEESHRQDPVEAAEHARKFEDAGHGQESLSESEADSSNHSSKSSR